MATTNTVATIDGFFKHTFADKLRNLIPNNRILQKELLQFRTIKVGPGKLYHQPVTVQNPQGFTFAGANAGAFAIQPAIAGVTKDAQVTCNQIVLEDAVDLESMSLAEDDKTAFGMTVTHVVQRMLDSSSNVLEYLMLHGQKGLGIVSSGTTTLTLTTASWASGLWAVFPGAVIEVYNAAGTTNRGQATVTAVDLDARTVTISAAVSGTIATDVLWLAGQKGNDFAGIDAILTNTGTLFNISATTYNLWKGRTVAASGAASLALLENLVGKCLVNGLTGDAIALVNTQAWNNLMTTEAALRRYSGREGSGGDGKFVNGGSGIEFHGQNGTIKIIAHTMVKEGTAYLLSAQDWIRIGSSDWSFDVGAMGNKKVEQYFIDMPQNAGKKLRLYTNQCVFGEAPGRSGYLSGVVNT